MRLVFSIKGVMLLTLVLLVSACAKNKVKTTQEVAYSGLQRPERVLVYNFATNPNDIQQNSSFFAKLERSGKDPTAEEMQLGREVADALATELTVKIKELGLNPVRATSNTDVTPGAIMITGRFVKIDEGNRLRRNIVGFGMGQSSLDSEVKVLAPGRSGMEELIGFDAHADSGNMPGAAVTGPAGGAAAATSVAISAVKTYKSASATQAKGMAEKIAAELAKYFAKQGWIDPSLAK